MGVKMAWQRLRGAAALAKNPVSACHSPARTWRRACAAHHRARRDPGDVWPCRGLSVTVLIFCSLSMTTNVTLNSLASRM